MNQRKWRILLVDDEASVVKMIRKRLEVEGFDVTVAMSGEEALQKVQEARPDLIVLDLMMPGRNGFDVCAQLKRGRASGDIPIVTVFSGKGDSNDEKRCLELGAAAYINKSEGGSALVAQAKALLSTQSPPSA